MRRMVVSCHVTVANYEYLVYWRFYQDGNIECEVRATGIMVTTPIAGGASPPRDDRRRAHICAVSPALPRRPARPGRDGPDNTVMEVDSRALPVGAENPYGLAVVTDSTPVRSESEAGRDFNWATQRAWKVVNPSRRNAHGAHPAYKLVPAWLVSGDDGARHGPVPARARDRSHALGHAAA